MAMLITVRNVQNNTYNIENIFLNNTFINIIYRIKKSS